MNHKHYLRDGTLATIYGSNHCHPERSLVASEASSQTQSKELMFSEETTCNANFRVLVRFYDECNAKRQQGSRGDQ